MQVSNRVMQTDTFFERFDAVIQSNRRVVLACHVNPDGDAVGSVLAMAEFLHGRGNEVKMVVANDFPDFLHWMPGSETVMRYDKRPEEVERLFAECDTIFCLDFNVPSRITEPLGDMLL